MNPCCLPSIMGDFEWSKSPIIDGRQQGLSFVEISGVVLHESRGAH